MHGKILPTPGGEARQIELLQSSGAYVIVPRERIMDTAPSSEPTLQQLQAANAALQASVDKYRLIADTTIDWEYWVGPDGKFTYVSPACERITGYRPEEFLMDPWLLNQIICGDDRAAWDMHHSQLARPASTVELEFRVIHRNGEVRWIGHCCQPVFDANGIFLGRRGSNRDITSRHRLAEWMHNLKEVPKEATAAPPPPKLTIHEKPGVLVIDDDVEFLASIAPLLSEHGYEVVTTTSGPKGLNILAYDPNPLHILLLDFRMPHFDGNETLQHARRIRPDIKIVAITALAEESLPTSFREGVDKLIRKPFRTNELLATLAECTPAVTSQPMPSSKGWREYLPQFLRPDGPGKKR